MDGAREFLETLRKNELVAGRFRAISHVLIGRRITRADGTAVSAGLTWRELSILLKLVRWDREAVREVGLDPAKLPPRDRQRFWYAAITQANVDSADARAEGDRFAAEVEPIGYHIGPAPHR